VSSVLFTRIALPEMLRFNYNKGLSAGCICAAGTFAALIPPSVSMVLYAILTGESVGALLMAGLIPGLLTAGIYLLGLRGLISFSPRTAPPGGEKFSLGEKLQSMRGLWAVVALAVIVMGGIYSGLLFPSAAGTAGAVGALAIGLMRRKINWGVLRESLRQTAVTTAVLFLIIIAGLLFSRMLLVNGFIPSLTEMVQQLGLTPTRFIIVTVLLFLVLGMFVDTISMMVMTIPFLYPVSQTLGIDGVWFGVILIKLVEIAAISPPVGLNLYAVLSSAGGTINSRELFKGVAPFLAFEAVTLWLLLQFPALSLWLPQTMGK
jgi:tripartite ATP-independent transporter DctM subunit